MVFRKKRKSSQIPQHILTKTTPLDFRGNP